jgi:hypothetical protein
MRDYCQGLGKEHRLESAENRAPPGATHGIHAFSLRKTLDLARRENGFSDVVREEFALRSSAFFAGVTSCPAMRRQGSRAIHA